ncbi:type I-F CRISPR-associated endoribonuclease Cas6/Csy4 [Photobacterium lutimaris]|uniref:Type I-F CRISPR-associated endoribonuclease Cas6/Csy4 n=1 Tax=Photobacterium lutimaris TaxID=388278 RepID=A0A2T3J4Q8_9GAMM|nr:type I-F CRISPR-associated endoribonuclease Cas6/Csy4 [Photobacterium lutimaris]PSU36278.1 type I-F CRISPR-associated endoribonuclease Cas6/Csy4 [Photobacterium lutimaris]TDR74839.1 CRISPR-associated Csy4 family protein [Photobacterium lutimaris]
MLYPKKTNFHYIDIRVVTPEEMSVPELRNDVVSRLHDIFADAPKHSFALAFPEYRGQFLGDIIRVFGIDRVLMDMLLTQMQHHFFFRDYTDVSPINTVPEDFKGPYVSYERYRVPNLRSNEGKPHRREKRLLKAKQLPHLKVTSNGNKKTFLIPILMIEVDGKTPFTPNGYGLGSSANKIALPYV